MPSNTLAPNGLVYSRQLSANSPSMQANIYKIKRSYASNIALGDLVKTLTGASQGYIGLATVAEVGVLGVFAGIAGSSAAAGIPGAAGDGYYDTSLQSIAYGLNGSYVSTASPPSGIDIGAKVI